MMKLVATARSKKAGVEFRIYHTGTMSYAVTNSAGVVIAMFPNLMKASNYCSKQIEMALFELETA